MSATAGKSILDLLWEKLDGVIDELMDTERPPHWDQGGVEVSVDEDTEKWAGLRGRALGLAEAIALITNVYEPDLDAVRAEAMERWETRP